MVNGMDEIWYSGQRSSAGTSKVIQCRQKEERKRNWLSKKKASNKIS